jgi:tetratricopeptide (TPR) repeat protein
MQRKVLPKKIAVLASLAILLLLAAWNLQPQVHYIIHSQQAYKLTLSGLQMSEGMQVRTCDSELDCTLVYSGLNHVSAARQTQPDSKLAANINSLLLWSLGKESEAIGWIDKFEHAEPYFAWRKVLMLESASEQNLPQLLSMWKRLGVTPSDFYAQAELARGRHEEDEAKVWYRRVLLSQTTSKADLTAKYKAAEYLKEWPQVINNYESLIHSGVADRDTWFMLGKAYAASGRSSEAVRAYSSALTSNSGGTGISDVYSELGWFYVYQSSSIQLDEALKQYENAVNANDFSQGDVGHASALFQIGHIYVHKSRYEDAIASYRSAVRLMPWSDSVHISLANALRLSNRLSEATEELNKAISINNRSALAYSMLSDIYLAQGNLNEARKLISKAISVDPDNAAYKRQLAIIKE